MRPERSGPRRRTARRRWGWRGLAPVGQPSAPATRITTAAAQLSHRHQHDTHLWLFFEPSFSSSFSASGHGCTRCTGPLAMSATVCPSRLTLLDVGALRHEIQDAVDVAARGGVMQRGVAVVVDGVDVGAGHFDQVLDAAAGSPPANECASWRRSLRRSRRRRPPAAAARRDRRSESAAGPTRPALRAPPGIAERAAGRPDASSGCSGRRRARSSSVIAATSPANAARQNGVAPISSTPARSKLYSEYHTFLVQARVRIGALLEQRLHEIEVGHLLLVDRRAAADRARAAPTCTLSAA